MTKLDVLAMYLSSSTKYFVMYLGSSTSTSTFLKLKYKVQASTLKNALKYRQVQVPMYLAPPLPTGSVFLMSTLSRWNHSAQCEHCNISPTWRRANIQLFIQKSFTSSAAFFFLNRQLFQQFSVGFFDLVVIRGAAVDFFLLLDGRECLTRNGMSCDEDLPNRLLVLDLLAVSGWRLLSEEGMLSVCAVS